MPDKKLTDNLSNNSLILSNSLSDNEIIKAFECCADINDKCPECPLKDKHREGCVGILMSNALDLIKCQKAEIEMLNKTLVFEINSAFERGKTEAYKEFAERLEKEAEKVEIDREGDFVEADFKIYDTVANWCKATSDNLLKELVGEDQ